jgi:hypothetical protein
MRPRALSLLACSPVLTLLRLCETPAVLTIRSASGDGVLAIDQADKEWWQVRLEVGSLRAEGRVDGAGSRYSVFLQEFVADLAANWRGWEGSKQWASIEGCLNLDARHDGLGHIELRVGLRGQYSGDAWRAEGTLTLEPGGLDALVREVQRFENATLAA